MKKDNNFTLYPLKIMSLVLIIIIIFSIIPTRIISASPLTYIPLDNWVYPEISRLETLRAFEGNDSVATNTLPLTRIEIAYLIDTVLSNLQKGKLKLNHQNLSLIDKLVNEFQDELSTLGLNIVKLNKTTMILDNLKLTLKINPYFTQKVDLFYPKLTQNKDTNKLYSFSELGAVLSGSFSENSAFYLDASVYSAYSAYAEFELISTIPVKGIPFQAQIKQAYIKLKLPSFEIPTPTNNPIFPSLSGIEFSDQDLLVGRDYMKWGPGYQGSLMLSDNSPAFDMLKYSGTIDLNDFGGSFSKASFTKFFSLLDQDTFFLGQRLEFKPRSNIIIGLSETDIISQDSSILFFNPLPFIPPYYVIWLIARMFEPQEVNYNVGLDMEINLEQRVKLYGEWMVDDIIFSPWRNPFPNRTAFLVGAYFADHLGSGNTDFRIEYTHINNYVYFPRSSWQNYLHQGEYIGHPLGPDADQLYLELTHNLSDRLNLSLSYTHERHGEGQTGIPLPSDPMIANEDIFLSGIIEKQQAYQAQLSYTISPQWEISAGITRENIKNKDNNIGIDEKNTYFQIELEFQW